MLLVKFTLAVLFKFVGLGDVVQDSTSVGRFDGHEDVRSGYEDGKWFGWMS